MNDTSGNASDRSGSGVSESTVAGVVFMTTLEAKGLKYECMIEVTLIRVAAMAVVEKVNDSWALIIIQPLRN